MRAVVLALLLLAAPAAADPVPGASDAVNAYRAAAGLAPAAPSEHLTVAAEMHARDMAQNGFFSHKGSNGSSSGDRARATGYRYCVVAENIAKGQRSLAEVMQGWANSPGHRANLLHPRITEFGLVRQTGDIWVLVLGTPGC